MSTANEMERMPASWTRRASQRGRRPTWIDPGDGECHEERARLRLQLHRITVHGLGGHRTVHRIGECHPESLSRLASDAADGEAVAAIRSDGDVEHLIA